MKQIISFSLLPLLLLLGCSAPPPAPTQTTATTTATTNAEESPRTILIGIDALSWELLETPLADGTMPHLAELAGRSLTGDLQTVQPMISPPNWTSISTGRSPEAHGIVNFFQNRLDIRVPTLWDRLAAQGLRVGLYDNLITWPPRALPGGFMIPGWLRRDDRVEPQDVFTRAGVDPFVYRVVDLGGRDAVLAGLERELEIKPDVFLGLVEAYSSDVAFTTFFAVDVFNHNFRHTWEPEAFDPPVAIEPQHTDAFSRVLGATDDALGKIIAALRPQDHLIIVSDHGTGPMNPPARKWAYNADRLSALAGVQDQAELISAFRSISTTFRDETTARRMEALLRSAQVDGKRLFEVTRFDREKEHEQNLSAPLREMMNSRPDRRHFVFGLIDQDFADTLWPGGAVALDLPSGEPSTVSLDQIMWAHDATGTHAPTGFFLAAGPAFEPRKERIDISVLDVAPLVFYLSRQPIPDDLEGRLDTDWIAAEYLSAHRPRTLAAAEFPSLPRETSAEDEPADAELEERLKALGYLN